MKKKILINAAHAEEKRVAIVEGETLVDFYVESSAKEHMKGNIYKGVVARIEPGLQAAFVNFGPKKHGFLQMREITSDYFKGRTEGKRVRIQDVISKGQELIVQVEKDERDTKGASLTTYISLPGRYIVMMPGQERVGISRKIEGREDRDRLKEIFNSLKLPKKTGFILRTAGSDRTGEELENDLKYLTKLWTRIQADAKKAAAPALIYKEQDIAVRTVRDYLTTDISEVMIDDAEAYKKTKEFLRKTTPWRKINIKLHKEKKPIFVKHNIEDQIIKLHDRYVHLPSRGYLVIDKAEALTAVDVNSGRSRKEENVEGTAFRTNMEAAEEVARQLRLRDIGGLIVIDFIDMMSSKNRREVENRLREALNTDKAHSEMTGISKFGMVEMTRERMRTAYFESVNKKCEVCSGTGIVRTDEMVAVSALRDMHARAAEGGIKGMTCALPVESINYLINTKREEIASIEKEFKVSIRINADAKLFPGQYTMTVEKLEEQKAAAEEKKAQKTGHSKEHKAAHPAEERAEPKEEPVKEHEAAQKPESEKRHRRSRGRRRGRRGARPAQIGQGEGPAAAESNTEEPAGMAPSIQTIAERKTEKEEEPTTTGETAPSAVQVLEQPEGESEAGEQPEKKRKRSRGRRRGRRGAKAAHAAETEEGGAMPAGEAAKEETPAGAESKHGESTEKERGHRQAGEHPAGESEQRGAAGVETGHVPPAEAVAETAGGSGQKAERPKRPRTRAKRRKGAEKAESHASAKEENGEPKAPEPEMEEAGT
jgi:ribonuclease E